jgi:hypothetical protein
VVQGKEIRPAWGRRRRPTCGPAASATSKERQAARAHELGQRRLAGLGPKRGAGKEGNGRARGKEGRRWAAGWTDGPNAREEIRKRFLFSFSKFQSIFKWNFEILFEFSNKAHNTKYYTAA